MKRPVLWGVLIMGLLMAGLFALEYLFLRRQGWNGTNFLLAAAILLPAALVAVVILLETLTEAKKRQDQRLEHLVRETLHEINLPLATIEANLAMIRDKLSDRGMLRRIERIGAASRRLEKLYRELAYELGREIRPAGKERFDLAELILERIEEFRHWGRNPLHTELEKLILETDRIGMEQVLDNLIENAMKYSPARQPVLIRLSGTELRILDRGRGMEPGELLHAFERYYQGDRQVHGEGIGLAIVKRFCDEQGISLHIRSRPGEGTEIILGLEKVAIITSDEVDEDVQ